MTSTFSILDRFFRTLSFSLAGLLLSAAAFAATAAPRVEMQTTLGKITLELDAAKAPNTHAADNTTARFSTASLMAS